MLALLMLVVLDCIVLGTLHLSLQEHRIGGNRARLLRLRLDAESGARRSLAFWSSAIDTMPAGPQNSVRMPRATTGLGDVDIERLGDRLFLVHSVARDAAPGAGMASARLLVAPPAIPPGTPAAPAPLSARAGVHVAATAVIDGALPPGCIAASPTSPPGTMRPAMLVADPHALVPDPGARIDGTVELLTADALDASFDRISELAPDVAQTIRIHGDSIMADAGSPSTPAVLIADGNLTIQSDALITGIIIARGSVTIQAGADVMGAVHAGGHATVAGEIHADPCTVDSALRQAGLVLPTPAGPRPWLPGF